MKNWRLFSILAFVFSYTAFGQLQLVERSKVQFPSSPLRNSTMYHRNNGDAVVVSTNSDTSEVVYWNVTKKAQEMRVRFDPPLAHYDLEMPFVGEMRNGEAIAILTFYKFGIWAVSALNLQTGRTIHFGSFRQYWYHKHITSPSGEDWILLATTVHDSSGSVEAEHIAFNFSTGAIERETMKYPTPGPIYTWSDSKKWGVLLASLGEFKIWFPEDPSATTRFTLAHPSEWPFELRLKDGTSYLTAKSDGGVIRNLFRFQDLFAGITTPYREVKHRTEFFAFDNLMTYLQVGMGGLGPAYVKQFSLQDIETSNFVGGQALPVPLQVFAITGGKTSRGNKVTWITGFDDKAQWRGFLFNLDSGQELFSTSSSSKFGATHHFYMGKPFSVVTISERGVGASFIDADSGAALLELKSASVATAPFSLPDGRVCAAIYRKASRNFSFIDLADPTHEAPLAGGNVLPKLRGSSDFPIHEVLSQGKSFIGILDDPNIPGSALGFIEYELK